MQQRQLRLGDVVDDYCPRERRITNHAIVALVGDEIRLTRCTTCDAEHEYKQARIPPQRKKKDVQGVLYQQVLSDMPRKAGPAALLGDEPPEEMPVELSALPEPPPEQEPVMSEPEEGPVHRRLIRATLPRIEGQEPPARREPEFTIRQQLPGRGARFGGGSGRGGFQRSGGPQANGHRGGKRQGQSGGPQRAAGGRPSQQGYGNRQRQGGPGGKKRSR